MENTLIQQILASSDPTKWTGEGFGSAQANAADMAKILSGIGITDIKQFGQIPTYQNLETRYTYNGQPATQNPDGSFSVQVARGHNRDGETIFGNVTVPANQVQKQYGTTQTQYYGQGERNTSFVPVDSSKVVMQNGQPVLQTGATYGNKATGQAVNAGYDRAGGNIFSGTFAGAGSTGYGVQYDAQGNPHFYTQYGGSTSDFGTIAPILGIAAAAFGVPALIGGALAPAAGAATQAALGGAVLGGGISAAGGQNPLQGALLGGAAGYLGNQFGGSSAPVDTGPTMTDLTGSAQPLQGLEQYAAPVAQTPVAQTPAVQAPDVTPTVSQPYGTSLADLGAAAPVSQVATNPTLADLTGNTGGLTGLDQYASIPTDLGAGGGNAAIQTNPSAVDYSLGGNANIDQLGGGQGLLPNTASTLDSMGGAQGINASNINPGLESMGGAQGLLAPVAGGAAGATLGELGLGTTGANILGNGLGNNLVSTATGVNNAAMNAGTSSLVDPAAASSGGLLNSLTSSPLGTAALLNSVAGLINSGLTSKSINNSLGMQSQAAQNASSTLKDIYNQQLGFVQPYQQTGAQGLNAISQNMPYLQHQFNAQDLAAGLAPNYDFMLQQGQMANQRAANVGGGAIGGNALQGLQKYTQDYAGNAYQNAFNNYQTQRNNIYNTLANIAGLGQTANQQAIGAGTNYGQQQTNLTTGLAAAQAGANVAQNQNTTNLIGNLANNVTLASLLGQKSSVG